MFATLRELYVPHKRLKSCIIALPLVIFLVKMFADTHTSSGVESKPSEDEGLVDIGEHYLVRRSDDSWRECMISLI